MNNSILKFSNFFQVFKTNIVKEFRNNIELQNSLKNTKIKSLYISERFLLPITEVIKPSYKILQFGDFCIKSLLKNIKINLLEKNKNTFINQKKTINLSEHKFDQLLEKKLMIPQYFGGIRNNYNFKNYLKKYQILKYFSFINNPINNIMRIYNNYNILSDIENQIIPNIFVELFNFLIIQNVSAEAELNLKKLRNEKYKEFKNVTKKLIDLRKTIIKNIEIKNFKKIIKTEFEFSVLFKTKNQSDLKHYNGMMEFIKDNQGKWICNNFNYEIF